MNMKVVKMGRFKIVGLITAFSVVASVLLTIAVMLLLGCEVELGSVLTSVIVPAIVAPCASWHVVDLMVKVSRLENEMRLIATYDKLTGCMTRSAFLSSCENVYQLIALNNQNMAIIYIDVDDFKLVNDTFGHPGGDEVLKSFGRLAKAKLRKTDVLGRIGGEEFALMLPNASLSDALQIAEMIRVAAKTDLIDYCGQNIGYTVSIGLALFGQANKVELGQLFKQSDQALYMAKNNGKDQVVAYQAAS